MAARRFEFVEGSSSKFWEIELDGSSFTTTWGKIGTAGQTGTKSFDSDDKAKKEYDKLVAEKTKKGYAETGAVVSSGTPTPKAAPTPKAPKAKKSDDDAPAEAAAPVVVEPPPPPKAPPTLAEEDQIFWSDALKKRVLPRRGGVEVKIVALHAEKKLREQVRAGFKAREKQQEKLVKSKADGADAIARVAKIIADDSGVPTADDAATMLAWLVFQEQWNMEMLDDEAVEWLIVAGSYALATEALLLSLERMFPGQAHYGTQNPEKFALYMQPTTSWSSNFHGQGALRGLDRLRELLVLASDADYQAARDAAAKVRSGGTDAQKVASSIVFPTESDWVRSDASLVDKSGGFRMVLLSVSDLSTLPATYAPSIDSFIPYRYRRKAGEPDCAATLLDTAGMSVASFFAKAASGGYASADTNKLWYATLAAVGHDDTVRVLVDKVGEKEAQAALAEAGQNQPRRVLRLLAKSAAARGKAGDPARAVLASLVRRSPELVDEVRPYLDADGTKAIDAAKAELGEAVADADSTDVPSFLSKPPWREAKKKAAGPQAKVSITPPATTMMWAPNQKEQ